MLVLSRKPGECLVIAKTIRVVITRISGNRVSVGIEAPDSVDVVREELMERPFGASREESLGGVAGVEGGEPVPQSSDVTSGPVSV